MLNIPLLLLHHLPLLQIQVGKKEIRREMHGWRKWRCLCRWEKSKGTKYENRASGHFRQHRKWRWPASSSQVFSIFHRSRKKKMILAFWLGLYFSDSNYVSKIDSHANLTDLVKEEEAQKPAALRWESEADISYYFGIRSWYFLLFWNLTFNPLNSTWGSDFSATRRQLRWLDSVPSLSNGSYGVID